MADQCDGHLPYVPCRSRKIFCQFDRTRDGRGKEGRELAFRELENEKTLLEDFLQALTTAPDNSYDAFKIIIRQTESMETAKLHVYEWVHQKKQPNPRASEICITKIQRGKQRLKTSLKSGYSTNNLM